MTCCVHACMMVLASPSPSLPILCSMPPNVRRWPKYTSQAESLSGHLEAVIDQLYGLHDEKGGWAEGSCFKGLRSKARVLTEGAAKVG